MCDEFTISNRREIKVIGDWIDILPNYRNTFDAVLSHLTHGNIPFERRHEFFNAIRHSIKPGGMLIDFVFQPRAPGYSIQQIIEQFKQRPANLRTFNDFNSIALFQSSAIARFGCVDTTRIYKMLEIADLPEEVWVIAKGTRRVTPEEFKWYYCFDRGPHEFGYYEGYDILAEIPEPPESPFANVAQLLVLQRRET
jgi:hypothetical protein